MKRILWTIVALGAVCIVASCNKEQEQIVNPELEASVKVTYIKANGNEIGSKASIATDGSFTWNTGDKIAVYAGGYKISDGLSDTFNNTNDATFTFSGPNAITDDRDNFAIYPHWLVYDSESNLYTTDVTSSSLKVNLPASYTLAQVQGDVTPCPMIADNVGDTDLAFKQLGAVLRITVNNIPPSASYLAFDFNGKKVQGEFTLTGVVSGTTVLETSDTEGTDDIVKVTDLGISEWTDGIVVNIPVPTGTYDKVSVTAYNSSDVALLSMTRKIMISSPGTWVPERRTARKITASLPAFSVSNSLRVAIAPSNLQYTRPDTSTPWTSGTWSFMTNPWDMGEAALTSENYGNETLISKFGWGTSGKSDIPSYNTNYYPWSTDETDTNYGPSGAYSLEDDYKYGDWGVYNNTQLGGYASSWRLPTDSEAIYLLGITSGGNADDDTNTKRYCKYGRALVNSVQGFIIVPDDFCDPMTNGGSGAFVGGMSSTVSGYVSNNTYSLANWAPMAQAGAVFLPFAGSRSGTSITGYRSYGFYWTSSKSDAAHARMIYVRNDQTKVVSQPRHWGYSVRLIRDLD